MKSNTGLIVSGSIPAALIKSENLYVQAIIKSRPMFQLAKLERQTFLAGCINAAIFIGGWQKKEDADLALMVNTLLPDINGRFKTLTEGEVKLAFETGAKGYYGETFGMSIAACISWLLAFQNDVNRANAKKELAKSAQVTYKPKLTRGEKQRTIQQAYDKFLANGFYKDYNNLIYDLLDGERMITYTTAEKLVYLEKGRKAVFDSLQIARDREERRENEKKLAELIESDTSAISEGKRIALIDYFTSLKAKAVKNITFVNSCLKF